MGGVVGEGRRAREDVQPDESNVTREESDATLSESVRARAGGVPSGSASGEGDVSVAVGDDYSSNNAVERMRMDADRRWLSMHAQGCTQLPNTGFR